MPMVPMYQGGVPSVVDSGQTGRQVAQLPNQTINYAKLMQDAQQPLQDFANNAGKALQTIAARNIKAESDEAEMKYMEAVQSRLGLVRRCSPAFRIVSGRLRGSLCSG